MKKVNEISYFREYRRLWVSVTLRAIEDLRCIPQREAHYIRYGWDFTDFPKDWELITAVKYLYSSTYKVLPDFTSNDILYIFAETIKPELLRRKLYEELKEYPIFVRWVNEYTEWRPKC